LDKVSCPGERKHSKRNNNRIDAEEYCNRTLFFITPEDKVSKIIVICPSCGRVFSFEQNEYTGAVMTELDKQQRIQYEQSLKVVLDER